MLYIFDMGGVVTNDANPRPRICSLLGLSEADYLRYCGRGGRKEDDLLALAGDGLLDAKGFWRIFSERSGIQVKTDWLHWIFHPVVNEDIRALIGELRAQGNRVVCGTNTIESHYQNHIEHGDYALFDQTYASCLMGVSKPDPDFWRIILTAEDVAAKDAVFTDDRQENVDAAAALGIRSILFRSAAGLRKELLSADS
jgi:putative hydrolase of the HAD superfamily